MASSADSLVNSQLVYVQACLTTCQELARCSAISDPIYDIAVLLKLMQTLAEIHKQQSNAGAWTLSNYAQPQSAVTSFRPRTSQRRGGVPSSPGDCWKSTLIYFAITHSGENVSL
ncbi:hypothetical protein ACN38_g4515 [Penicillium nordicum]|uniref:Uncharacterized protein n=1 Tax=Penicillium nordicum TaxID=229535 RepID=A0A0N0RZ61_9EURO|nr:hypothetical protein ACN38_g4515 [Penicillium nordicum]